MPASDRRADVLIVVRGANHRPRQRTGDLGHVPALRDETGEPPPAPVVDVAGRVPEIAEVATADHVAHPPDRLERHRGDERVGADADEFGERPIRIGEVLEHLDREDEVERRVGERQLLDVGERDAQRARPPVVGECPVGEVDPDDARVGEPVPKTFADEALAETDLEDSLGPRRSDEPIERRRRTRSSSCARSGSSCCTCRTCCRWARAPTDQVRVVRVHPVTSQRIQRSSDHTSTRPSGFGSSVGCAVLLIAPIGVEVGRLQDGVEFLGLERSSIGQQRHRARSEEDDDRVGRGVLEDGLVDRLHRRVRRSDLRCAPPASKSRASVTRPGSTTRWATTTATIGAAATSDDPPGTAADRAGERRRARPSRSTRPTVSPATSTDPPDGSACRW